MPQPLRLSSQHRSRAVHVITVNNSTNSRLGGCSRCAQAVCGPGDVPIGPPRLHPLVDHVSPTPKHYHYSCYIACHATIERKQTLHALTSHVDVRSVACSLLLTACWGHINTDHTHTHTRARAPSCINTYIHTNTHTALPQLSL